MATRYEIIQRTAEKYQKASKKKKGSILDMVCESTGLSRDRAARLMAAGGYQKTRIRSAKPIRLETRGRKQKYGTDVVAALITLWELAGCPCGKKLAAAIPELIDALVRHNELDWTPELQQLLREVSPATIDRLLEREKKKYGFKGRSTTKAGKLLKKDIPIRTGTGWDDAKPGYVEIDLVAHCGDTTAGQYVNTLNFTDISTGWTETRAVRTKAQKFVFAAIRFIRRLLPFDLLGIDSDNGSEFINDELYRYCIAEEIALTRSRAYHKNDGCYVEQKNGAIVRNHIGYNRYEGQEAVDLMNEYYAQLRLLTNYFLPQTKLISKEPVDGKTKKRYDKYVTPYNRVLASPDVPDERKEYIREVYETLNPAALVREMSQILKKLQAIALPYSSKHSS